MTVYNLLTLADAHEKARRTIRNHADGLGISRSDLVEFYGWDPGRIAVEMVHTYAGGWCPGCNRRFAEMPPGHLTVEIIDPNAPPVWGYNTRFLCAVCNSSKGDRPLAAWTARAVVGRAQLRLFTDDEEAA